MWFIFHSDFIYYSFIAYMFRMNWIFSTRSIQVTIIRLYNKNMIPEQNIFIVNVIIFSIFIINRLQTIQLRFFYFYIVFVFNLTFVSIFFHLYISLLPSFIYPSNLSVIRWHTHTHTLMTNKSSLNCEAIDFRFHIL